MLSKDGMEGVGHLTPPAPPFCPTGQLYTVVAGDTLFFIAQRFGVSLQALIGANPQIQDPDLIFPGQIICVPVAPGPGPVPQCPGATYTVVQGDTLFRIAQRFGVTLEALLAVNPQITNPDLIFPGQVICLPVAPQPPQPVCPTGLTYMVMPGDTLFSIAQRLGVSVEEILFLNPQITDPNMIQPGDMICVPFPSVVSPIEPPMPPAPMPPMPMPPEPMPPMPMPPEPMPPMPMPPEPMPPMPTPPMPPPTPCPPMPCPPREERPFPCPGMPVVSPSPCPPREVRPYPCPGHEERRYPSVPGTPMPAPYYPGSFVYANPPVKWEDCPYRKRRRRRICRRRRKIF